MAYNPVHIFPWQKPFLPDLKKFVDMGGGMPVLVAPNKRPWRHLLHLYQQDKKALILPKMFSYGEVVSLWVPPAKRSLNKLDQISLLHECVRRLAREDEPLAMQFSNMDIASFFPWGARLSELLEELFMRGLKPGDVPHLDYEMEKPAAALLGAIGRIFDKWRSLLENEDWSTPGFTQWRAGQTSDAIPARLLPSGDRPVYIIGFNALSGVQNRLFNSLWKAGAHICLHTDPGLATGADRHWSCNAQRRWLGDWGARTDIPVPANEAELARKPEIHFFSGYDAHSQMNFMREALEASGDASTAIALSHPGLLMPVLHHLPDQEVNISMGYPLRRTRVASLFEDMFRLAEMAQKPAGATLLYWKDLLRLFNQPFLKKLAPEKEWTDIFAWLDGKIRDGARYVDINALLSPLALDPQLQSLLNLMVELLVKRPALNATLLDLGEMIGDICAFLLEQAPKLWDDNPLDAEALAHFKNKVAPVLKNNELARQEFSLPVLHSIFWQIFEDSRVPFEGDPITGTQILGMLETRLLQFDRAIIMDATADILPGNAPPNPLLPDPLRLALRLPTEHQRQEVMAHNFFRLIAGAREVFLSWQEGRTRASLFDDKKEPSPFARELIWREELKRKKLLRPGEGPLRLGRANIMPLVRPVKRLPKSAEFLKALESMWEYGMSPSSLQIYLQCPYKFALAKIIKLVEAREVKEGEDAPLIGECLHDALRDFYTPHKDKSFTPDAKSADTLLGLFQEYLREKGMEDMFPMDSQIMLELSARRRFKKYFDSQPGTVVKLLENDIEAVFEWRDREYKFKGRIDRLDERKDGHYLLDYKAGTIHQFKEDFWRDGEFFNKFRAFCDSGQPFDETADDLLVELRDNLPDLQLPAYMPMLAQGDDWPMRDAAFVEFKDSCREKTIFGKLSDEERSKALEYCRIILEFISLHMANSPDFAACPSDKCSWCDFADICKL